MLVPHIDYTANRERISIVKACVRHIVHSCRIRMEETDRTSPIFDKVRNIQHKYGSYLYDSLESTPHEELENILVITPALVRRILDPHDTLENIL